MLKLFTLLYSLSKLRPYNHRCRLSETYDIGLNFRRFFLVTRHDSYNSIQLTVQFLFKSAHACCRYLVQPALQRTTKVGLQTTATKRYPHNRQSRLRKWRTSPRRSNYHHLHHHQQWLENTWCRSEKKLFTHGTESMQMLKKLGLLIIQPNVISA